MESKNRVKDFIIHLVVDESGIPSSVRDSITKCGLKVRTLSETLNLNYGDKFVIPENTSVNLKDIICKKCKMGDMEKWITLKINHIRKLKDRYCRNLTEQPPEYLWK